MHCFFCCKETLEEFNEIPDEDFPVLFKREVSQELSAGDLSAHSYEAVGDFFASRMHRTARYQLVETDENGHPYVVLVCFMHWFDKQ